jgi:capsular polysaccharide biosynthesis protein
LQEQPLDVRAGIDIIKRRRIMVGVVGAAGLMLGVLYWAAHPTMPSATAQVVLPTAVSSATAAASSPSTATQKAIATSPQVLDQARMAAKPPVSEAFLKSRLKVAAVGSNVLSISVKDSNPTRAEALANGVANGYISVAPGFAAGGAQTELTYNRNQESTYLRQMTQYKDQMNADGPSTSAGQFDQLQYATAEQNLANLLQTDSTLQGQISANTPQMLQKANAVTPPSRLAGPEDAAGGLAVGLVIGAGVALWRGRRDRRLRRRDDLARSLGLPVVASLDAERCERAEDWNLLLDTYQPDTVDAWSLRRLLRQLDPSDSDSPVGVQIVSYAEDEAALSVGVQMASFAAGMGISTTLLAGDHYAIETLRAACAISAQSPPPEALLSFVKPDPTDSSIPPSHLTITVVAVDRRRPHFEMSGGVLTFVALSAGLATSDDLARLALAANDAGTILDAIIVVNPDEHDYTAGELPARAMRQPPTPRLPEDSLPDPIAEAQDEE